MPGNRGFCEHGKVWTTCQICGKEVIAAAAKRGSPVDEFGDFKKKPKKPRAAAGEEAVEEAPAEDEPAEAES